MLRKILVVLAALLAVLVFLVARQPDDFRVTRSATISAPADRVFAEVNDFHRWTAWSPFEKDPAMARTFAGQPTGTGAIYEWSGNRDVGAGRSTIVDSRPNDLIRIKLEFLRPFAATNTAEFSFVPRGEQTSVTWTLYGRNTLLSKAIGLFMSMDAMVGTEFENGLGRLKAVVESSSAG